VKRQIFEAEHEDFRGLVRAFARDHVEPHLADWNAAGQVDRSLFLTAGRLGLLGLNVPEEYGGGGVSDFRYNAILSEELSRMGATSVSMNLNAFNDLVVPYLTQLCTDEQKQRWLPDLCAGRLIAAIAMTEPGSGSDLRSMRTTLIERDGAYVLNGSKIFISNGHLADLIIVAGRTGTPDGPQGLSLVVIEDGMPGLARGRRLSKIGLDAQDTAELFFDNIEVPSANLLGEAGKAFGYLRRNLARERITAAVGAVASMHRAFDAALGYTKEREAFGQRIADFQSIKFRLAEMATEVEVARAFLDRCIMGLVDGDLSEVEAAMCKWWTTELQQTVVTRALQLHGGYGYMREYPIAQEFLDSRASTFYAGTTEIMKEIIGRSLVGRA
jgi:alkylation response protein AidB-like acyl-CoA dehydrogenase